MKELPQENWPGLPKWPGVFVTGKSVTPEQAKDIIFRTDTSIHRPSDFMGGNDRRFQEYCMNEFGWKPYIDLQNDMWASLNDGPKKEENLKRRERAEALLDAHGVEGGLWQISEKWADEMQIVYTEYVYNSHLSSAYIGGPTGWVSINGNISVDGHNYGKWPSVEAIVKDWTNLVTAFPYLDVVCSLFNGESCEDHTIPVCTIVIRNGKVTVCEPDLSLHDRNKEVRAEGVVTAEMLNLIAGLQSGRYTHEQGWPKAWIEEFAAKSRRAMQKVAPFLVDEFDMPQASAVHPLDDALPRGALYGIAQDFGIVEIVQPPKV